MSPPIEVWAPYATTVTVVVDGERSAMTADPERAGWFLSPNEVPAGTEYLLDLDGEVVPDPLARWAPHGVHGPSRMLDAASFQWRDSGWAGKALGPDTVIYEMHVGTFTVGGTLDSAVEHLLGLVDLGVTHVELMPVAAFDGHRGWGYDGVALNAVHEPYGGPAGLARFVDAAHRAGLAVLLDVVYNHMGPTGNYWAHFGPFFTDEHTTPWGDAVNLDAPGSDDVRAILISSALGWITDYHLDGLRLDAIHELRDRRAFTFLEELATEVTVLQQRLRRPLTLIAESDRNDPRTVTGSAWGGLGLAGQWDDDVHHALHWLVTGENHGYYTDFADGSAVAHTFERAFLHDGRWSSFRGRRHGRPVDFALTPPWRFVAALQTHDQIGNRAHGERVEALASRDLVAAGALLLLSLPYTPMLFMGQEWGASSPWQFFTSFADTDLGAAVTKGRRGEFADHGWDTASVPDPQDPGTFTRSTLRWEEVNEPESTRMRDWYRDLIRWHRRDLPGTPLPKCRWQSDGRGRPLWWSVSRGPYLAVANLSDEPVTIAVGNCAEVVLAWTIGPTTTRGPVTGAELTLAAGESCVLNRAGGDNSPDHAHGLAE